MSKEREYWLIPKRSDLHQAIIFVHGIYENYDGKSWNASAQDRIGSYLAKNGATNNGRNISPQSVRTLLAGIPQFFGFINKIESIPARIEVTKVGKKLIEETLSQKESYRSENLKQGHKEKKTISHSELFELQFRKLQLTNPKQLSYCHNISVFPIFCLLKFLDKLKQLSKEEIAMYLFKVKDHSEIDFVVNEVQNFRNLSLNERKKLINNFKKTDIGNKALVKAPSTSYFLTLCSYLKCFNVNKYEITLNKKYEIDDLLDFYENIFPFDFKDDDNLWNDFFSNNKVKSSPKKHVIKNNYSNDVFITYKRDNKEILQSVISCNNENKGNELILNTLEDIENEIQVICCETHDIVLEESINGRKKTTIIKGKSNHYPKQENKLENIDLIIEHCSSKTFDSVFRKKIDLISKITGNDFSSDKNLRGGRLEELFFKMLQEDFKEGFLKDEPIWNGSYDNMGMPRPAPGGNIGYGDIVLLIDDLQIIFELTTIKSKSGQERSEAFSVPHHIKNHADKYPNKKTIGIYLAPVIHDRVTKGMESNIILGNSKLFCFEIDKFLNIYETNKTDLVKYFSSL
tara:strand:+ start:2658 stop:4376 length:1719 start_codon:yes stop_codon:yes gene_type:complete